MLGLMIISKGRTYTMRSHSMKVLEKGIEIKTEEVKEKRKKK